MKKKMCDHPADILFAVLAAFFIAFINYSVGDMKTALISAVGILLIYCVLCWLCKKKEDSENEEGK